MAKLDIHLPVRPDWLALHSEPVLDQIWRSSIRIIISGIALGRATCCRSYWRIRALGTIIATISCNARRCTAPGPESMKPIGETEFVTGVAAAAAKGVYSPTLA